MAITTRDLYPEMMQSTRLLIIDYNTLRFHSYDYIRMELMKRDVFDRFINNHRDFPVDNTYKQIRYIQSTITDIDPLITLGYNNTGEYVFPNSLTAGIQDLFTNKIAHTTMTDFSKRIGVMFNSSSLTGYIARFKNEKTIHDIPTSVNIIKSDNILNADWLVGLINMYNINAIILDSVDLAVTLAYKTQRPISFMIATYGYNFTKPEGISGTSKVLKGIQYMNALEYKFKPEFGIFDPFSDLPTFREDNANG